MPVELAARRASAVLWSRDASTDGLFRVKLPKNAHPAPLTLPVNKLAEGSIRSPEDTAMWDTLCWTQATRDGCRIFTLDCAAPFCRARRGGI